MLGLRIPPQSGSTFGIRLLMKSTGDMLKTAVALAWILALIAAFVYLLIIRLIHVHL